MKVREPRKRVTTPARMRTDSGWSNVTIRDVSSRGLGLRCSRAPRRGDYIELCRNQHKLIGRVMWSEGESFGVLLSDSIAVDDLLSTRSGRRGLGERRLRPRQQARRSAGNSQVAVVSLAQNSHLTARLMNFIAVAAIACIGATLAASLAGSVLSQVVDAVSAGFDTHRAQLSAD